MMGKAAKKEKNIQVKKKRFLQKKAELKKQILEMQDGLTYSMLLAGGRISLSGANWKEYFNRDIING